MFDVFTEEIEVQIKEGIANLYWYKDDLKKAWLRSGVEEGICHSLFLKKTADGKKLTKRQLMDALYEAIRRTDYNKRLEVSRNFVRTLVEHKNFVPQDAHHRIEKAETCALKLKDMVAQQQKQAEYRYSSIRRRAQESHKDSYCIQLLNLQEYFKSITKLNPHSRGYELEKIFTRLMRISGIPVEEPFKIEGEQIDGAIKYDAHHYLLELKWIDGKVGHKEISSLYLKVEGKLDTRGIFIAMNGFSKEVISSLPRGKAIKVLLLDGVHITNVIAGTYTFQALLERAISQASRCGEIYCGHDI